MGFGEAGRQERELRPRLQERGRQRATLVGLVGGRAQLPVREPADRLHERLLLVRRLEPEHSRAR